jgi:diguanylate cyclase (GGDEF)-like protein
LSLYYFVVVALVAWKTGRLGITVGAAIATSLVWLGAEWLTLGAPDERVVILNGASRLVTLVCMGWLISRLKTALETERALARTDFVTDVLNSRAFHEEARAELERARRYRHPLAVGYLDLDNFKSINDSFGHSHGNDVLRSVAATLKNGLRTGDCVCRVGGDEFVVLLPETGYERARQTIVRLQVALDRAMETNQWPVTFSIGVAVFENPASDVDSLIKKADEMMYQAKASGKNRFRIYSDDGAVDIHSIDVRRAVGQ